MKSLTHLVLSFLVIATAVIKADDFDPAYKFDRKAYNRFLNDYSKIFSEKNKDGFYNVKINPITTTEGIMTGCLILFGHVVKPPYVIENIGDSIVMANNVNVYPGGGVNKNAIIQHKLDELSINSSIVQKQRAIEEKMYAIYDSAIVRNVDTLAVVMMTVDFVKKSGLWDSITRYHKYGFGYISDTTLSKTEEGGVCLPLPTYGSKINKPDTLLTVKRLFVKQYINQIQKGLISGGCVFLGAGVCEPISNNALPKIKKILLSRKPRGVKKDLLKPYTDEAVYFLDNFIVNEWEAIK